MIGVEITAAMVKGGAILEPTPRGMRLHRLPRWVREQYPDGQLMLMEAQPSGVRLVFRTTAGAIDLVTHPTRVTYRGTHRPRGVVDVVVDGQLFIRGDLTGGDKVEVDLATGGSAFTAGPAHLTRITGLPLAAKRVEIWLPHNEAIDLVSLSADAPLEIDVERSPTWVHHGSSISHGSNAETPSGTWPAIAARRANVDLHNLGFGGSALVDPFMARVIRDTDADVISIKLGINVVNTDAMRLRAFVPAVHGFLDTIRDGHPTTPILLVSPIFTGIHETTPGPGAVDTATLGTSQVRFIATGQPADIASGKLTLEVIRRELAALVERRSSDPNLHYINGLDLFGASDAAELPLPDGLHPGPSAHRRIGERFANLAFGPRGSFSAL